ncbi:hypothetical protein MPTK1_2g25050 [Marchantia polymorpha subsp. ruderalis]|uniref:F-box domain-containing protein n=1 Tax=Marchantia polymorpha TaxID=3197 RepID=A0A2R6W379_MARPO|nr:hypothetical protein MARPO_0168s0028 [Marchantia polymorpha]BBN03635.1 hypothetical protein Mp_2g25050 [Marchantia polymorpha subsp. ruderalis]|eukprot:PTQ28307.1 hypothetical protein MARPO_0168s0028 [Marchantia polymorpha]
MRACGSKMAQDASMNEDILSKLPEDLTDRILARLPLHSLFRMRSVCKKWSSLLFSSRFVDLYSKISPQKPWIVLYTSGELTSAYNCVSRKWHNIPIPILSPEKCVLAASEGLLCFGNEFFPWPHLFVCNPMTKFWQNLPSMSYIKTIHVVGMTTNPKTKSFRILVSGLFFDEGQNGRLATEVYDSTSNSWIVGGTPWPIMAAAWKLGAGYAIWCNGLFYCITFSPFGVIAYDIERRVWSEVQVRMPASVVSPSLLECKGRLLMVGGSEDGVCFAIRIWRLEPERMAWEEIVRMPPGICKEFVEKLHPSRHFFSFGNAGIVCLTISESTPALMYDFSQKSWQWLPDCPWLPDINNWQLRGISFEPRLHSFA